VLRLLLQGAPSRLALCEGGQSRSSQRPQVHEVAGGSQGEAGPEDTSETCFPPLCHHAASSHRRRANLLHPHEAWGRGG